MACGQRHILALDKRNNLLAWGANHHGQCGQNSAISKHVEDPSSIEWDKSNGKIVDIVSGWTHCMLLTGGHFHLKHKHSLFFKFFPFYLFVLRSRTRLHLGSQYLRAVG